MTIERSGPRSALVHPWSQFTSATRLTGVGLLPLSASHHCEYFLPDLQSVGPRYRPACFGTVWGRSSKPKGPVRLRIYPNRFCSSGRAAVFSVQHLFCFSRGNTILDSHSDSLGASLEKTGRAH